jgi:hypothetical protein
MEAGMPVGPALTLPIVGTAIGDWNLGAVYA